MTNTVDEPIRLFVGTDRSQRIGLRVLEYSIGKHTAHPFEVHSLESIQLPEPEDKRNVQRTGFSFSRFAIPELCDFRGKAIYMDADMLVFQDIARLWNIPFQDHKMLVQADVLEGAASPSRTLFRRATKRPKQTAVSLLDCSRLHWNAEHIVAGLDGRYTYKELMSDICILDESEIGYQIPAEWNSLEHFDSATCNLHYTDMQTQPWVCASNRLGYLWLDTVREMLDMGELTWDELEEEVRQGFARPSLLSELKEQPFASKQAISMALAQRYAAEDLDAGFQMHKAAYDKKRQREAQERDYLRAHDGQWLQKLVRGIDQRSRLNLRENSGKKNHRKTISKKFSKNQALKILFVANSPNLPTLQIAFTQPLSNMVAQGLVEWELLTEWMINENARRRLSKSISHRSYVDSQLKKCKPDLVVLCRYTGVAGEYILDRARKNSIAVINCFDDDLLDVPIEIGIEKYNYYRDKKRQARMRYLLDNADLIYSSTESLSRRIKSYGIATEVFTASVFCPAMQITQQPIKPQRFGYMGFGHEHDIKVALPGIIDVLRQLPEAEFELFGTIPKPPELLEFGHRVRVLEPEWDYEKFMQRLASRGWAVGICPLADLPFNEYKASTKWLEYTSVGAAVIASDHAVYRRVIAPHSGVLVEEAGNWFENIHVLLNNEAYRTRLVAGALNDAAQHFSPLAFERQFIDVLDKVGLNLALKQEPLEIC